MNTSRWLPGTGCISARIQQQRLDSMTSDRAGHRDLVTHHCDDAEWQCGGVGTGRVEWHSAFLPWEAARAHEVPAVMAMIEEGRLCAYARRNDSECRSNAQQDW
jgi:hypothetical protein